MAPLSHSRTITVRTLLLWALFLLGSVGTVAAIAMDEVRLAVTAVVFLLLIALSMVDIRLSILGLFAFLTVLGDLRRLLIPLVGWSGADPVLMVAPVFTVLLMGYLLTTGRLSTTSTLSRLMILFTGIMVLQIVNPIQGGLAVGIAGAILVIVPTFWFWIGQAFGSEQFLKTLFFSLVLPLSIVALCMGFVQLAYGYLPYQLEWYRIAGYSALGDSEDTLRPLSIFPSITEYLTFLTIAFVVLVTQLLHRAANSAWKPVALLLAPTVLLAILLSGSRGPVVICLFILTLLWAIRGQTVASWVPRFALAALVGTMGLVWTLQQASTLDGPQRVQYNLNRQADLVQTGGTSSIHAYLGWVAVYHGTVKQPLGMGIGSITLAASKFGGQGFNSEKDITNMFIATGVVGGVVYVIVVFLVARSALRYWIYARTPLALILVGVIGATGFGWLHPGHYLITPLIWMIIGALDRLETDRQRTLLEAPST